MKADTDVTLTVTATMKEWAEILNDMNFMQVVDLNPGTIELIELLRGEVQ